MTAPPNAWPVPDGFVIVPIQPTQEMLNAARAPSVSYWGQGSASPGPSWTWSRMLAAAPAPPVQGPGTQDSVRCDGCPEEWRTVPSIPELEASSWGRIRRKPFTAQVKEGVIQHFPMSEPRYGSPCRTRKNGQYKCMYITYRGIGNKIVHRLVCEAFHGPPPKGKNVVIHLNENAYDNRPVNLKWGDHKENKIMPKIIEYRKSCVGENSNYAKHRRKVVDYLYDTGHVIPREVIP